MNSLLLWLRNRVARLVYKALRPHDLESIVDGIELRPGCPVRVEIVVAPGEVLSVVDSKVHMVQRVVSRAIDKFLGPVARNHVAVMNEDRPDLHCNEKNQVEVSIHRADEHESTDCELECVQKVSCA